MPRGDERGTPVRTLDAERRGPVLLPRLMDAVRVFGGPVFIALAGLSVLLSWYGVLPEWVRVGGVSMKPVTAGGFVHVGIVLAALASDRRCGSRWSWWALAAASSTLLVNSLCLFWGTMQQAPCAIELILPRVTGPDALTAVAGHPSTGTAHGFAFCALAGLLGLSAAAWRGVVLFGALTAGLGALALVGWVVNAPVLYWYTGPHHTAMAYNTAGLFLAAGALTVMVGAQHRRGE